MDTANNQVRERLYEQHPEIKDAVDRGEVVFVTDDERAEPHDPWYRPEIDAYSGIIAASGMSPIFSQAFRNHTRLSAEEQAERNRRFEEKQLEERRKAKILKNICPACSGKLTRGKKNKRNAYKRDWTCTDCDAVHSV